MPGNKPAAGVPHPVGVPGCRARMAARTPSKLQAFLLQSAKEAGEKPVSPKSAAKSRLSLAASLQSKLGGCQSKDEWQLIPNTDSSRIVLLAR